MIGYPDVYQAGDHMQEILPLEPIGLEGFDDTWSAHAVEEPAADGPAPASARQGLAAGGIRRETARRKPSSSALRLQRELGAPPSVNIFDDGRSETRMADPRTRAGRDRSSRVSRRVGGVGRFRRAPGKGRRLPA